MPNNIPMNQSRHYPMYCNGLIASYASTTSLTLSAGACSDSTGTNDIVLPVGLTINTTVHGVNGLDTGSLGASNFYYVYVIGDSSQTNNPCAIISLSSTMPVMPYGYDLYRQIDIKATTSGSVFAVTYTTGNGSERKLTYDSVVQVLTSGVSTTYQTISLAAGVPPINQSVIQIEYDFTSSAAPASFSARPYGSLSTTDNVAYDSQVAAKNAGGIATVIGGLNGSLSAIDYITVNPTALNLYVYSFTFNI